MSMPYAEMGEAGIFVLSWDNWCFTSAVRQRLAEAEITDLMLSWSLHV